MPQKDKKPKPLNLIFENTRLCLSILWLEKRFDSSSYVGPQNIRCNVRLLS